MKRLILALLSFCCLLSGCSIFRQKNYVSVTPHQEQSVDSSAESASVSNYSQLEKVFSDLVEDGTEQALLSVANYDQTVLESHLKKVIRDLLTYHPIGAYAVDEINYELGTNAGQSAISVQISYIHDRSEIRQIRHAADMERACVLIKAALDSCDAGIVIRIDSYDELDFTQMVEDYVDAFPEKIIERPEVSVGIYPNNKLDDKIVELKFTYQTSRDKLRSMQTHVKNIFDSAVLYVTGDAEDWQKFAQLYSFLMERYDYQIETSITPAYSLLRHGVGDSKAFAVVYSAMCRLSGLDCQVVSGTREGETWYWNIVKDGERYYHVDLLRCMEQGGFHEQTDGEMSGYVWDYSAFPACTDDPVEETQPEDTTAGTTEQKDAP